MDDAASSSYFHHHRHLNPNPNQPLETLAFSNLNPHFSAAAAGGGGGEMPNSLMFPHSVAGQSSAPHEPVKRKRGRPRKYGVSSSLSISPPPPPPTSSILRPQSSPRSKKELNSHSPNKSQAAVLGNAGKGFTAHVITVAAGEDVAQNIMSFVQRHKQAVCILSVTGSISDVSLCQPDMAGVKVTYEGKFEIISFSGSFLHMETGGASTINGRLNICVSGADGHIVGGGVAGPLIAACSVQIIVGSFLIDPRKNISASSSMANSGSKMSAPMLAGTPSSSPAPLSNFQDSLGRMIPSEASDDNPNFGGQGNSYMFHSQGMSIAPSRLPAEWRGGSPLEHGRACLSADDEDDEVDFRN